MRTNVDVAIRDLPTQTPGSEIDLLISLMRENTALCREQMGEASNEAVCWQPFNKSHSLGGLLLHITDVEARWLEEIVGGRPRPGKELATLRTHVTNSGCGVWAEPPEWPLKKYYEVQDSIRERSIQTLRDVGDPMASFRGPDCDVTLRWIVSYLIAHEAYHMGQAVLHRIHHGWAGAEPEW